MPHHTDTIADWLVSNRLYEDNLFYYVLIICFWFFIGFIFLGFELQGFSQQQNLFFNFIYYLIICACMALCPFWFKLFFGKTHTAKREQELQQALDELDEYDRAEVEAELAHTGGLAMRPIQKWAIIFLGSYFLFEVFFISAWVKDMALVWEPDWVMGAVEWVRGHVNIPPLNVDRDLFTLEIDEKDGWLYDKFYQNELGFMNSNYGIAVLFYHFIRVIFCVPVLMAFSILLWRPLLWLGIGNISPEHIEGLLSFVRACAWSIVMGFFLIVLMSFSFRSIGAKSIYMQNIGQWMDNFGVIVAVFFFCAASLRFFAGWFLFWKRVFFYR